MRVRLGVGLVLAATTALPSASCAQDTPAPTPATTGTAPPEVMEFPFRPYSFYMGAISTSLVLVTDETLCPPGTVCPIGDGGGIFGAWGRRYRSNREWLVGYEFTARNSRAIFTSGALHQARFEHRWVITSPFTNFEALLGVGGGVALYGEFFAFKTIGPVVSALAGGTYNLTAFVNVGVMARLDAMWFLVPFYTGLPDDRANGWTPNATFSLLISATFLGR